MAIEEYTDGAEEMTTEDHAESIEAMPAEKHSDGIEEMPAEKHSQSSEVLLSREHADSSELLVFEELIVYPGASTPEELAEDSDTPETDESPLLILASASPRRREILEAHGVDCVVVVPRVSEASLVSKWERAGGGTVAELVMELAHAKAQIVYEMVRSGSVSVPDSASQILAADTLVVSRRILGKPRSDEEALAMLMELSGKSHEVYTGVALIERDGSNGTMLYDHSLVTFDAYSEDEALAYVETGEPLDKAGAYAIQGLWGAHVTRISGDYENIVGLPWHRIEDLVVTNAPHPSSGNETRSSHSDTGWHQSNLSLPL